MRRPQQRRDQGQHDERGERAREPVQAGLLHPPAVPHLPRAVERDLDHAMRELRRHGLVAGVERAHHGVLERGLVLLQVERDLRVRDTDEEGANEEDDRRDQERAPGQDPEPQDGLGVEAHALEADGREERHRAGQGADPEQAAQRDAGPPSPAHAPQHLEDPAASQPSVRIPHVLSPSRACPNLVPVGWSPPWHPAGPGRTALLAPLLSSSPFPEIPRRSATPNSTSRSPR